MTTRRTSGRTKARRRAIDVLFEADSKGVINTAGELDRILDERRRITVAQGGLQPYAIEIVEGVAASVGRIDEIITSFAHSRPLKRMAAVDRAILRLGVWEVVDNDDLDDAVAISEAVALAEELSTEDSPGFVNAFLDRVSQLKDTLKD